MGGADVLDETFDVDCHSALIQLGFPILQFKPPIIQTHLAAVRNPTHSQVDTSPLAQRVQTPVELIKKRAADEPGSNQSD